MLATTAESTEKILARLKDSKMVVFDVETSGLDWKRNGAVGYVLTFSENPKESFYVPVRHGGGGNCPTGSAPMSSSIDWMEEPSVFEKELASVLVSRGKDLRVIGHNLKFDMHMSMNHGIDLSKNSVECTMVNESLIDENAGRYSLDASSRRRGVGSKLGDELYEHMANKFGGDITAKAQMGSFWKLAGDDPFGYVYAATDGTVTWNLRKEQHRQLEAQELMRVWGMECRTTRTLFRTERRGIRVDQNEMGRVDEQISTKMREAEENLPVDFNVRSPKQIRAYLESVGRTDWPKTDKGNPSFKEDWLSTFEHGNYIVNKRSLKTLMDSFVTPLKTHAESGRVHTEFNQTKSDDYGTVTGRLSSAKPNMQQIPKRKKEIAEIFRAVFTPDDGYIWSSNDYVQQELVVFTEYSGAESMMRGYNSNPPIDGHSTVAEMLGVERDPTAKRMNLGMLYGMGSKALAGHLGVSVKEAKDYIDLYNRRIPEAKQFLKFSEQRARARGWVKTKLGRRRRFPDPRFAHKAGNSVIQGSSADITKLKMAQIDEYFESEGDICHLLLQVHDELDWQFPKGAKGKKQNKEAMRIMQDFSEGSELWLKRVPLAIENRTGKNWAIATFGE